MAYQRIRDPLNDLIEFSDSELEMTLWGAVQTRPFQRLRRVKQLGFSDFVYPGATHSRFAHSLGVFHTARRLMEVVRRSVKSTTKEDRALAAALLHDVGHGPFSHAFEAVGKTLGLKLASHEVMSDILIRDSEISEVLNQLGTGFSSDVADIIQKDGVKSVQHAVVSSQFDADRLDYMRRDCLMSGTQHAAIDFEWLIQNLEIAAVPTGVDETQVGSVDTFVLGPKAIYAAEAFVLGLFQLYPTVYFHKATRGAEKIFTELMVRVVRLVRDGCVEATGLPGNHPLIQFAEDPEKIQVALSLDDTVVWGALTQMPDSRDRIIAEYAKRLRDRDLLKCIDIRTQVTHELDPSGSGREEIVASIDRCCVSVVSRLSEIKSDKYDQKINVIVDNDQRSPYKSIDQSKGPLERINIKTAGGILVDLKERSSMVAALTTFKLLRAYVDRSDKKTHDAVRVVLREEIDRCR